MGLIKVPYNRGTLDLHVEEKNLKGIITASLNHGNQDKSEVSFVEDALAHPIGIKTLKELAEGKKKVVLITSDHTRAVPSKITLPILLREIRKGNANAEITILIATGLHRPTSEEEQRNMFGDEIVDHESIISNDAFDSKQFQKVCDLPSGAEFYCNKLAAVDCDLLVTEGFIEPHFFAGFSGGRKSILPGICNAVTVNENHSYRAISSPFSTTGELKDNPIHRDMIVAARAVNVQFILNVALDAKKKIIAAFAGDLEKAHEEGVTFVRSQSQCQVVTGDIVITSNGGYPLDQNLYQSPKAVTTAEACAGENGVIIMCCACDDGFGGSNFQRLITSGKPDEIDGYLEKIPPKETIPEQWCAQIYARILKKHPVILVTTYLDHELVKKANMIPASSPDEALEIAYQMKGCDASVVVIPDGVSVLAVKSSSLERR
ncbi:MAG: nickel-dependent lactate racemase [Anaerocolumna sp.]